MLTEVTIKSLKPKNSLYRVADKDGLSIEVPSKGALRWRYEAFRHGEDDQFGHFPDVSLAKARTRLAEARRALSDGIDPSTQRQQKKREPVLAAQAAAISAESTFAALTIMHRMLRKLRVSEVVYRAADEWTKKQLRM